MSLILPTEPAPASMTVALISTKNTLTPATGGDEQEIGRKGSKYALTFSMPVMAYSPSMPWSDLHAEGETVVMRVFQPGFDTGAPGAPLVKGAGQIGSALIVDGLTPGYVIRKGQFLSVLTGGQRFLYRARADVTATGGEATIQLGTLLRRPPADNAVVEIAQPMIEGFVRDLGEWTVGVDRFVNLQFTVRERE